VTDESFNEMTELAYIVIERLKSNDQAVLTQLIADVIKSPTVNADLIANLIICIMKFDTNFLPKLLLLTLKAG
jgi:hypothetical protein